MGAVKAEHGRKDSGQIWKYRETPEGHRLGWAAGKQNAKQARLGVRCAKTKFWFHTFSRARHLRTVTACLFICVRLLLPDIKVL